MFVVKRDGKREPVSFDKILRRVKILCKRLKLDRINIFEITKETINSLHDGISTKELDHCAAVNCSEKIRDDPQYDTLATGLCISRLHKTTTNDFMETCNKLNTACLLNNNYYNFVKENIHVIQAALSKLSYHKDYDFDYFGFKTLERAYLFKVDGEIVERPQHMWMRVALALNTSNIEHAIETYHQLSDRNFIFGSPTLFNAGTKYQQCSSCFLLNVDDDLESIMDTMKETGMISKRAGGIGICASNIRASGSLIKGTNGNSTGIVPMIQVFNWLGRYVNQGGKRKGAIAMYLEPWHADIFNFCELRSNKGNDEDRARDIFLALWIPDLFMERVLNNSTWSLMCPNECPGLTTCYGDSFKELYERYEAGGKYKQQVNAKKLWFHILTSQLETGMPYMLYKDNVNNKTNQQNLGVIQSSNLCSEIVQFTSSEETAVCNLSSICLPKFIERGNKFNFEKLRVAAGIAVRNLNNVIDINFYPSEKAKISNLKHRPVGLGVQGLADVFCILDIPYDSEEARVLNKKIFETIYFGALSMSMEMAKSLGAGAGTVGAYPTFHQNGGSPFSKGILQYHMWGLTESDLLMNYNWKQLIEDIKTYGTRNSLLTTVMPTASTSQIMGNTESIEPIATNVYTRSTMAGEFTIINRHLVEKLIKKGIWNSRVKNKLLYDKGSVQKIEEIPQDIKDLFKTAYEIKNKPIVQQSIDRGPFIDQSQSLNLFCLTPDFNMLTSSHFYGWKNGLKTGLYYLKTQPAVSPLDFGLDIEVINEIQEERNNFFVSNDSGGNTFYVEMPCGESCSG